MKQCGYQVGKSGLFVSVFNGHPKRYDQRARRCLISPVTRRAQKSPHDGGLIQIEDNYHYVQCGLLGSRSNAFTLARCLACHPAI
tara:strand:+ start:1018 stop:1272 length:255 start_codon:yes stop_codon:yes gene_type:complete